MCLIMVCQDEKPTYRDVLAAHHTNNDGIGLMFYDKATGKAHFKKGMSLQEGWRAIKKRPLPFAVHFRFATVGGAVPLLTHPFPIEKHAPLALKGDAEQLLMHNGHMLYWEERIKSLAETRGVVLPQGKWSDTRAMAWLASYMGIDLFDYMTEKVVVLDAPTQSFRYFGTGWTTEGGITYSNLYWRWAKHRYVLPFQEIQKERQRKKQERRLRKMAKRNNYSLTEYWKDKQQDDVLGIVTRERWDVEEKDQQTRIDNGQRERDEEWEMIKYITGTDIHGDNIVE